MNEMPEYRDTPENVLDFNMQVINPDWKSAKPTINTNEFGIIKVEENGKISYNKIRPGHYINVDDLMAEIDFFSRDIRLSNYDAKDMNTVRWFGSFGGDMIASGHFRAFRLCFKEIAVTSESSQARGGFLRKILQTLTHENINKNQDQPKKSWLTGSQNGG